MCICVSDYLGRQENLCSTSSAAGKGLQAPMVVPALSPGLPAVLFCASILLAESYCMWSLWHFAIASGKGKRDCSGDLTHS